MEATPHLLTSVKFRAKKNSKQSLTLEDRFIECCLTLNASAFEPYMSEDDVFENKDKYLFLSELKRLFQPYHSNTKAYAVRKEEISCLGCSYGKRVVRFIVSSVSEKMDVFEFGFVIYIDKEILKDIYRCWQYKECSPYEIKPEGLPAIMVK